MSTPTKSQRLALESACQTCALMTAEEGSVNYIAQVGVAEHSVTVPAYDTDTINLEGALGQIPQGKKCFGYIISLVGGDACISLSTQNGPHQFTNFTITAGQVVLQAPGGYDEHGEDELLIETKGDVPCTIIITRLSG